MILAKIALGIVSTLFVAGVYVLREGVMRLEVDDYHGNGSHVHVWVPAAAVPIALHLAPKQKLAHAIQEIGPWLPTANVLVQELEKFPNADLIDILDGENHIQIRTSDGKLQIDVREPDQTVHLRLPLLGLEDLTSELEAMHAASETSEFLAPDLK
ncbi:MAG TPA: hypothetical protein VOA64_17860 [Candidatus Dormibacteraeota bacterium]|nr:hypothetical protein [Candidatus Dormibacteraeota bacterium]